MRYLRRLMFLCVATLAYTAALPSAHAASVSGGRYGNVEVTEPSGPMRAFVVLFSKASGWNPTDQQAADLLAINGALVVGVDTARYAATLAATKESCHQLVGDVENMSHQLEREQRSNQYFPPIAAGVGQGGVLAEHILAQAPANTIAGALSIEREPKLDPRFNPCPPDPTISRGNGLPGFWEIGQTAAVTAKASDAADVTDATTSRETATRRLANIHRFRPDTSTARMLLDLLELHIGDRDTGGDSLADLPLIELPTAHPSDMLAIVISGDGGWRDLDKTIAEELQKKGVSVVGWDSLRYFWSEKPPEQTSRDLARVMTTYGTRWHARHVALIGYSFGADVMPFAYNRLPQALRAKVSLIALLGFAHAADFQIRVTGWLGMPASRGALPAAPEIAKVPAALVQCFYGAEEDDTLCPTLAGSGVDVIRTAGAHHFGRDYGALAKTILDGWQQHIARTHADADVGAAALHATKTVGVRN
jgi:type IV secretory pathway VirJ component